MAHNCHILTGTLVKCTSVTLSAYTSNTSRLTPVAEKERDGFREKIGHTNASLW